MTVPSDWRAQRLAGQANAEFVEPLDAALRTAYHVGYGDGEVGEYDPDRGFESRDGYRAMLVHARDALLDLYATFEDTQPFTDWWPQASPALDALWAEIERCDRGLRHVYRRDDET